MTIRPRHSARSDRRRGFTLLEMLVVIGIIILLVGLTVTVTTGMLRGSEVREMENALRIVDAAITEWELAADKQIRAMYAADCDNPPQDLDVCYAVVPANPDDPAVLDAGFEVAHDLLRLLDRSASTREFLAGIDARLFRRATDAEIADDPEHELRFRDPWDQDVIAVFPEILFDPNNPNVFDDDRSRRNVFELRFGIAASRRPYLVSAGPDGRFGHLHLDKSESSLTAQEKADIEAASDNVFTYPVLRTRP